MMLSKVLFVGGFFCNSDFEICSSFLPHYISVDNFWFLIMSVVAEDHPSFKKQLIMPGKIHVPCQELALGHLIVCTRMFWPQLWCLVCHQSQIFCAYLCRLTLTAHFCVTAFLQDSEKSVSFCLSFFLHGVCFPSDPCAAISQSASSAWTN